MADIFQTAKTIGELGVMSVISAVAIVLCVWWIFKVRPKEQEEDKRNKEILLQQVTLSRVALENSTEVIKQNTQAWTESMAENRSLRKELGVLKGAVHDLTESIGRHDCRSENIARDLAILKETSNLK